MAMENTTNSPTKITDSLADIRLDDGTLPIVAWPGCYPMLYIADDGETICPACANSTDFTTDPQADADGFRIDGAMVHWEGPTALCAHCNAEIESAYGDPDAVR